MVVDNNTVLADQDDSVGGVLAGRCDRRLIVDNEGDLMSRRLDGGEWDATPGTMTSAMQMAHEQMPDVVEARKGVDQAFGIEKPDTVQSVDADLERRVMHKEIDVLSCRTRFLQLIS